MSSIYRFYRQDPVAGFTREPWFILVFLIPMNRRTASLCLSLVAFGGLCVCGARAESLAQSSLSLNNFTINTSFGNIILLSPWTADAFAQADDDSFFNETVDGVTPVNASGVSLFGNASSLTDPSAFTSS